MLKGEEMGKKSLAEAIILQSMEDLWDEREDSLNFFDGEGFNICAELAGMGFFEQLRLYNMINKAINREGKKSKNSRH